jgi:homoserine O-succinyltransferase
MFGVFKHNICDPKHPLFRGFDDFFFVPHSRHSEIRKSDIVKVPDIKILSESDVSGVSIVASKNGREFFFTGHAEYSPDTLDREFKRDRGKNLPIDIPVNYYVNNNPDNNFVVTWRSHANLLFVNWLNYFVYQITPFNIESIE